MEIVENQKELRRLCISMICEKCDFSIGYNFLKVNNIDIKFSELINNEEKFNKLINSNNVLYYDDYYYTWKKIDIKKIFKDETQTDYLERENILKSNENGLSIEKIKTQISELKNEKIIVNSLPLQILFEKYNFEEIFDGNIKNEDLLKFLIKQGHINENYSDYISYFYECTLTRKDKDFIRNVMYEKPMDFNYELKKIPQVLNKLHDYQFKKQYILNFYLMDYIIENKDKNKKYENYYSFIINQLSNESESSYLFIDQYLYNYNISKNHKDIFLKSICNKWTNIWCYIQLQSNYPKEKLDCYLKDILQLAEDDDILKINENNILTKYISKLENFLELEFNNNYIDKIKELLKKLKVKFKSLNSVNEDNSILNYIYENELYEINIDMISMIMNHYSLNKDLLNEKLLNANYTTIQQSNECTGLFDYITNNINEYLENVFIPIETNVKESINTIIDLINDKDITDDNKERIIKKEEFVLDDITKLTYDEMWKVIIENNKCEILWRNVINYYLKNDQIDHVLSQYLNIEQVYVVLSNEILENEFEDEIYKKLCIELINSTNLTENSFNFLVKSIPYQYNNELQLSELSDERVHTLIKNNNLALSIKNYNMLRESYNDGVILLIKQKIDEYIQYKNEYDLKSEEILNLLNSEIYLNYKKEIIENVDVNILKDSSELINKIREITLINDIKLNNNVIKMIIENESDIKNNIEFLVNQMDKLSEKETFELLNLIDDEYSEITIYGKRPKIKNNYINRMLVEKLEDRNFISSKTYENDTIRINNKRSYD